MPVTRHPSPVTAFVALGSNLDDPPGQIRSALRALAALPETRLVRESSFYRNPPEGGLDQPAFVNAVRDYPNAPRTLDLDIALYGDRAVREDGLVVPHPRMLDRAFVLVPLAEIAPDAVVPGRGRVADLARNVDASGMIRLSGPGNG
jgi:2-amino-4-hydroxy-6-hydroxymethyldihydropteridine diphosphokinase